MKTKSKDIKIAKLNNNDNWYNNNATIKCEWMQIFKWECMNQHNIVKYAWMTQEWMRIDDAKLNRNA